MCRKAFDSHCVNFFIEKEIELKDGSCSMLCPYTIEESQDIAAAHSKRLQNAHIHHINPQIETKPINDTK